VNTFKDHYRKFNKKTGERVKKRHEGVILTPGVDSKHSGDVVPVSHRSNNNAVQEFEQLKRMNSGMKVIGALKAKNSLNNLILHVEMESSVIQV
jgi:hypothetical protein